MGGKYPGLDWEFFSEDWMGFNYPQWVGISYPGTWWELATRGLG